MKMEYSDLVHDEADIKTLEETCPYTEEGISECDRFYLDRYMMSEKPWFMPGVNLLQLGGFNTMITYRTKTENLKSWEDVKKFVAHLTKELDLKSYLVFKTCPGCGIELPVVDYRIREDGLCTFCGGKERESLNNQEVR